MLIDKDIIKIALSSSDYEQLASLASEKNMFVRKAVAQNKATPTAIINRLAYDPTSNVVFFALNHKNCTVSRKLTDVNHPCVQCNIIDNMEQCKICDNIN